MRLAQDINSTERSASVDDTRYNNLALGDYHRPNSATVLSPVTHLRARLPQHSRPGVPVHPPGRGGFGDTGAL